MEDDVDAADGQVEADEATGNWFVKETNRAFGFTETWARGMDRRYQSALQAAKRVLDLLQQYRGPVLSNDKGVSSEQREVAYLLVRLLSLLRNTSWSYLIDPTDLPELCFTMMKILYHPAFGKTAFMTTVAFQEYIMDRKRARKEAKARLRAKVVLSKEAEASLAAATLEAKQLLPNGKPNKAALATVRSRRTQLINQGAKNEVQTYVLRWQQEDETAFRVNNWNQNTVINFNPKTTKFTARVLKTLRELLQAAPTGDAFAQFLTDDQADEIDELEDDLRSYDDSELSVFTLSKRKQKEQGYLAPTTLPASSAAPRPASVSTSTAAPAPASGFSAPQRDPTPAQLVPTQPVAAPVSAPTTPIFRQPWPVSRPAKGAASVSTVRIAPIPARVEPPTPAPTAASLERPSPSDASNNTPDDSDILIQEDSMDTVSETNLPANQATVAKKTVAVPFRAVVPVAVASYNLSVARETLVDKDITTQVLENATVRVSTALKWFNVNATITAELTAPDWGWPSSTTIVLSTMPGVVWYPVGFMVIAGTFDAIEQQEQRQLDELKDNLRAWFRGVYLYNGVSVDKSTNMFSQLLPAAGKFEIVRAPVTPAPGVKSSGGRNPPVLVADKPYSPSPYRRSGLESDADSDTVQALAYALFESIARAAKDADKLDRGRATFLRLILEASATTGATSRLWAQVSPSATEKERAALFLLKLVCVDTVDQLKNTGDPYVDDVLLLLSVLLHQHKYIPHVRKYIM